MKAAVTTQQEICRVSIFPGARAIHPAVDHLRSPVAASPRGRTPPSPERPVPLGVNPPPGGAGGRLTVTRRPLRSVRASRSSVTTGGVGRVEPRELVSSRKFRSKAQLGRPSLSLAPHETGGGGESEVTRQLPAHRPSITGSPAPSAHLAPCDLAHVASAARPHAFSRTGTYRHLGLHRRNLHWFQ